jgi:hypothetical protein
VDEVALNGRRSLFHTPLSLASPWELKRTTPVPFLFSSPFYSFIWERETSLTAAGLAG